MSEQLPELQPDHDHRDHGDEHIDPPALEGEQQDAEPEHTRQEVSVAVPMMQIPLQGVHINVARGEDGVRGLLIGPVMVTFVLPLDGEAARSIGTELTGGIEVVPADRLHSLPSRRGRPV